MSLSGARSVTGPTSLKIVGQGVVGVHGAGVVTLVMTSESSGLPGVPGCVAPRRALQRVDDQVDGRAALAHDVAARDAGGDAAATSPANRVALRMASSAVSS